MLVPEAELADRVSKLAAEISEDYAGKDLVLIGVLKGAVFFLSDLMRALDLDCEVDFMAVASYGSATKSSGVVRILKDLDAVIEGRHVLIVEDIIDSGLTLQYLLRNLAGRDPALAGGLRAADEARLQRDRQAALCRLRDPRQLRGRLRPRPRRALPQPALCCGPEERLSGPNCRCYACFFPVRIGRSPPRRDARSPAYEPFLQERSLPDPHRGRAGVLRFETGRQLQQGDTYSFGTLVQQVNSGAVSSNITLDQKDNSATVVLKDGTKYTTGYPDNYTQPLVNDVLKHEGGSAIDVQDKSSNAWLSLLTYLLPFVIFIGFWLFLMNQVQGGGSKVMSFGKSRAKRMSVDSPEDHLP